MDKANELLGLFAGEPESVRAGALAEQIRETSLRPAVLSGGHTEFEMSDAPLGGPWDGTERDGAVSLQHGDGRATVILLIQGVGSLRFGAQSQPVSGPSLLLLPCGMAGQVRLDPDARGFFVTLERRLARLISIREPAFATLFHELRALTLEAGGEDVCNLKIALSGLIGELKRKAIARLTAVEAHLQLLLTAALRLLEQADPPAQSKQDENARPVRLVSEFLKLVEAHCKHNWRMSDYARALHLSAGHLRAICTRVMGVPPVQLIHACLIVEAKQCLTGTSLSIGEVARKLGFDDPAYFSRLFHAKTGLSPKQYRLSLQPTRRDPSTSSAASTINAPIATPRSPRPFE